MPARNAHQATVLCSSLPFEDDDDDDDDGDDLLAVRGGEDFKAAAENIMVNRRLVCCQPLYKKREAGTRTILWHVKEAQS